MMKRFLPAILAAVLLAASSCSGVHSESVRPTKNLILMVPDGTSSSLLAVTRWYERYLSDSLELALNMDPYMCGFVQSRLSNSLIPDSAPAMSGYMTGVPCRAGNLSIYPVPDTLQDVVNVDPERALQPAATLLEAAATEGKATGIVVTVHFSHATPAATAAHTSRRWADDEIKYQMASNAVDVVFGGGADLVDEPLRQILAAKEIPLIENDVKAFREATGDKLWYLGEHTLQYELDRDPEVEPSLHEMTAKAIKMLSHNKKGFFLMVEGSKVDYGAHANDPIGTVTEFIEFDKAVKVAIDFAKKDGNTTVVVLPDHGNSGITLGDRRYRDYSSKGLDSMFVNMAHYKATPGKMQELIKNNPAEEIANLFKEWEGIELKPQELELLKKCKGKIEGTYTDVSFSVNLGSAICGILNRHTHLGYTSGNHTGEDVFLAVYNPFGQRPEGIITNTELNEYMQKILGLKTPLCERTEEWFQPFTKVFPRCDSETEVDPAAPTVPTLHIYKGDSELTIKAFRDEAFLDGERIQLEKPAVYMVDNDMFYIPASLGKVFEGK